MRLNINIAMSYLRWLVKFTLMVTFGFSSQNLERWRGPLNGTLSFYGCRFSGGDAQTLPSAKESLELSALTVEGMKKLLARAT